MDTRRVDELGRIVLPIELRRALDLVGGGGYPLRPVACGSVCPACAELIRG